MSTYFFIFILVVCVYYDSRILRERDEDSYKTCLRSSPLNWAISSFLLSAVSVPIYLYRRWQFQHIRSWQIAFELSPIDYLSDALGVVVTWLTGVFFIMLGVFFFARYVPVLDNRLGEVLFSTTIETFLLVFLIFLATRKYPGGGFWETVGFPKRKISFLRMILLPAGIGLVLAYWFSVLRVHDMNSVNTPLSRLLENSSSLSILIFIGSAILIAPLIEEIIFRGYLYGVLSRLKGKVFAVVFVAMSFALMHVWQYWGDWMAIGAVTFLGFVLTLMRSLSGVTVASVVTHYIYNGFSIIFPVLLLIQTNSSYFEYMSRYDQLEPAEKEVLLKESIHQQPRWHRAYNDLAWLYAEQKKHLREALSLIELALEMDPGNDVYWDTKAQVLFGLNRFKEAVTIEQDLILKNPKDAMYQQQLKKFQQALKDQRTRRALRNHYI